MAASLTAERLSQRVSRYTPRSAARAAPSRLRSVSVRAQTITETVAEIATPTGPMRVYVLKPTAPGASS